MNVFLSVIILGIVEGLTEFLPISSTGHLILMNQFISLDENLAEVFNIVIQLGAILSVVIYFRKKLFPFGTLKTNLEKKATWDIWKKTIVGVIPALFFGALFDDHIKELLFNPITVSIALVLGGVILIAIEKKNTPGRIQSIGMLSYKTAFFIGLIQCLAMIPGTSRSASTIIGAMLLGASRVVAAEFSFFLAIPTMAAASGYSLLKAYDMLSFSQLQVIAVGFIVSFLVAWAVIAGFMSYISKKDFKPFGYYRIILGCIVLLVYMI